MDMGWLASEAVQIHSLFAGLFYSIVLTLLLTGVVLNYFKMPIGQVPEFLGLVGRAVVAALLLAALPEIMNTAADITDQLSREIGGLNNFSLVMHKAGEKLGTLSWSWVSVKDSVLLLISYVTFFLLYVTAYLADAMFIYTWTLLYIFSPLLIAAFVLPVTAAATKALFQSLLEVCLWKIVWSVMAVLLWSFALSKINQDVNFLTAILVNLLLVFSMVITPFIVRGLLYSGISNTAGALGGAILGTAAMTPPGMLRTMKNTVSRVVNGFKPSSEDAEGPSREKSSRGAGAESEA